MSSAVETRPRVIRPGVLGLLALAVGSLLTLLFPGLDFGHPKYLGPPDELSIAYLEQVLRIHPGDRSARLLLARQQRALGKWDSAEGSLRLLAGGGDRIATQAELELLEVSRARLDALPPADLERPLRQQQSLAALRLVAPAPLGAEQLARLAETALALEAPSDAAELYERLAATDPANRHDWLLRAARWRRASGALGASVDLYLAASHVAPAEWAAREDVVLAVEALTAADRGAQALTATDTALGRWPTDRRLLDRGVTLARAQGDAALAKRWSERLIQLGPDDDLWLRRHLEVELGAGDVAAAFPVAERLVARHPGDLKLRRRLAETALWSGHPEAALAAWSWLASHGSGAGSDEASRRTLALGHDLFDHGRVAEVLQRKADAGTITLDELIDLSDALESAGTPEQSRAVLQKLEPTFAGARAYWDERGEVAEHLGDLAGALAAVTQVQRRFGPRAEDGQREVELLWALGRPEEALAAARRTAPLMTDEAVGFWRLYGDLAWTLEADDDAEASYLRLWALDQRDASVADRLVTLANGRRQVDEVIRIGGEGFTRFASPALLVAALDAATDADRWDDVRHLVGLVNAGAHQSVVADQVGFWEAEGRLLNHDGNPRAAAEAFGKVVALSPDDPSAREDLLWARVDAALEREPPDPSDLQDGDDGKPDNDAGARLAAAIDRHDRAAVREILNKDGQALTPSEQIDAARELGDDQRAWKLVQAAPHHTGDPDEDLAIAEHRHQLAEERLSGVWTSGGVQALGTLDIVMEKARAAMRLSRFGFEALAEHARLDAGAGTLVNEVHADEWRGGAALTLQESWGDSRIEGGAYSLPTGSLPYLAAVQRWSPTERVDLEIEGLYHQLPTDSAALRVAGLRDVIEAEGTWRLGGDFSVGGALGASRYTARDGGALAKGWFGRAEIARAVNAGTFVLRPRADAFAEQNDLVATLPPSLVPLVRSGVQAGGFLPSSYATTGVGLSLMRRRADQEDEIGSARSERDCAPCLRPFADVWAGWLFPAQRLTLSVEAGLGYMFVHHQELSATGFYYSDYRGEAGQHYGGAALSYTLRWL
jgi:tetratricopeptide (TPR) repeat protein